MIRTQEEFAELSAKVKELCVLKGYSGDNYIGTLILEDGNIEAMFLYDFSEEPKYDDITSEFYSDLDIEIAKLKVIKKQKEKKEEEKRRIVQEELSKIKEKDDYAKYLELKNRFETKNVEEKLND